MTTFHERAIDLEPGDVIIRDFEEVEVEEVAPLGSHPHPSVRVQVRRPDPEEGQAATYEFWTGSSTQQTVVGE